jgi:hypothetical protein
MCSSATACGWAKGQESVLNTPKHISKLCNQPKPSTGAQNLIFAAGGDFTSQKGKKQSFKLHKTWNNSMETASIFIN